MRVWVDDIRSMPPEYDVWCKTYDVAIVLLNSRLVTEISLDHDLGEGVLSGYDIAEYIEQRAYYNLINRIKCHCHSANPVGKKRILAAFQNASRYWDSAIFGP